MINAYILWHTLYGGRITVNGPATDIWGLEKQQFCVFNIGYYIKHNVICKYNLLPWKRIDQKFDI